MSDRIRPYGTWSSPITVDLILADARFGRVPHLVIDGGTPYWDEVLGDGSGRTAVMRRSEAGIERITPDPHDAKTRVHTYGGSAFTVHDGVVYFSDKRDDRVYRVTPGEAPRAITPEGPMRYADFVVDRHRSRLIAVREDHRPTDREPVAAIVAINLHGAGEPVVLVEGHDFYAGPTVAPTGGRLAFFAWDHPNMPWDETVLYVANIDDDGALQPRVLAKKPNVSVGSPTWAPDDTLHYVSDETGWWNLVHVGAGGPERYGPVEAEVWRPHWSLGRTNLAFLDDGRAVAAYTTLGAWRVALIDPKSRTVEDLDLPYEDVIQVRSDGRRIFLVAGAPHRATAVAVVDPFTGSIEELRRDAELEIDATLLSTPELHTFPSGDAVAHVHFYPPRNSAFDGPPDERPPLIVLGHGGPTASAGRTLDLSNVQYWTSRGFAVAKVDYRGSTGYGTAFRRALDGGWGELDVADCVNAARYLAGADLVDGDRMAIAGRSAGGLTVLAALAFHDTFRAGISYYGISDLELLAEETHKFESRYVDRLIAPFATNREIYRQRSPIRHVENIRAPLLFFQGDDDVVVPPNQSALMVDTLRARGVPTAFERFEGEGHGFGRSETLRRCLEAQHDFLARVFGFTPPEGITPVTIDPPLTVTGSSRT